MGVGKEVGGVGRSHGGPGDGIGRGIGSNVSQLYQRSGSHHRSEEWSCPRMRDPQTQHGGC